jgi:hypothetical protein
MGRLKEYSLVERSVERSLEVLFSQVTPYSLDINSTGDHDSESYARESA